MFISKVKAFRIVIASSRVSSVVSLKWHRIRVERAHILDDIGGFRIQ